jgi:hypothetical protein
VTRKNTFFLALFLSFSVMNSFAAQSDERGRGEDLTLKVAVMGPGDELYFWWGHIALLIEDRRSGRSRFYDYGVFSFDADRFFTNFAFGRLFYMCAVSPADRSITNYINTNRDVTLYTLDLPPEKREEVRDFVEINTLPENRTYNYHHFYDNCSTRIRDIIDLVVEGRFKDRFGDAPGRFTLRQHVRRHTWFSPFADWILNFWMGQNIDTPITIWEEMFLPSEVEKRLRDFSYIDANGVTRKLVSGVETVYKSRGRPRVLDIPRIQWPRELAFSVAVSIMIGFFCYLQSKNRRAGQTFLGLSHAVSGLVFGAAGLILYFMTFFTNHDYTFHNANVLFGGPLLLAAVPLGIRYALARDYESRFVPELLLRLLWLLAALGTFVSMLIKLLPWFWQQNLTDQALILPIALTLALQPSGLRKLLARVFRNPGKRRS